MYRPRRYMNIDKLGHHHLILKNTRKIHHTPNEIFVPPYVKKHNRRNKHLLGLLHGTNEEKRIDRKKMLKQTKNLNLFEKQRANYNYGKEQSTINRSSYKNIIPGEKLKLSYDINNEINNALNAIDKKRKHIPDNDNYLSKLSSYYSYKPRKIGIGNNYSGNKRLRLPLFGIMQREKRVNQ